MEGQELIGSAAAALAAADVLLIGAGAGMGVDSGLPDFRGEQGFWRAYPRYRELGMRFVDLANGRWFEEDPAVAWGFYGHRLNLYRSTVPHAGFALLQKWARRMSGGAFVFTSNVDGQFQRAGFPGERVLEIHGSIHHMQCLGGCGLGISEAAFAALDIDETTMRARDPLPRCPRCNALLRPNILMFNDFGWDSMRSDAQSRHFEDWLGQQIGRRARFAVVECGAGVAIPSVRRFCARVARQQSVPLIRINPREHEPDETGAAHIGISSGALAALQAIDARLDALRG